jgi:hypothetical protein
MAGGVQPQQNFLFPQNPPGFPSRGPQPTVPYPGPADAPYRDPVTSTPINYPTAGVNGDLMYGTAADMKKQQAQNEAESALSAQNSQQMMQRSQQQSQLQAEAMLRMQSQLPGIMNTVGGGGAQVHYGGNGEFEAAKAAAFARSKDAAGRTGRAALDQLRDLYAGNNMADSGSFLQREGDIVSGAAGQVGEMNRQQLLDDINAETHAADQEFQGGITQRGQNISLTQALLGLMNQNRVY